MGYERVLEHIERMWEPLTRFQPHDAGTLIGLPRPYVVPSDGAMFQEMYYWDSFFISLGLVGTPHAHLIADVAENFAYLIERFGVIPNGTRYYFLSRSQPPFFIEQIKLALAAAPESTGAPGWLARMLDLAEREHETVWLGTAQPHHRLVHRGLSRYFDINYLDVLASCESGWDHSTRCDERWLEHLPVDLNSILYARECDLADFAERLGQPERAARWRARAAARQATIVELMWDETEGFFFDYDFRAEQINPHASLAGFYPLWAGLASAEQAAKIVERWLPRFQQPGGLVTTLTEQAGRQWAWPNGWAPLQWLVAAGLERYGYRAEAREARRRWSETCLNAFERTGAFWEKYNVVAPHASTEEGLYGQLHGFGWTNGVLVDFLRQGL